MSDVTLETLPVLPVTTTLGRQRPIGNVPVMFSPQRYISNVTVTLGLQWCMGNVPVTSQRSSNVATPHDENATFQERSMPGGLVHKQLFIITVPMRSQYGPYTVAYPVPYTVPHTVPMRSLCGPYTVPIRWHIRCRIRCRIRSLCGPYTVPMRP